MTLRNKILSIVLALFLVVGGVGYIAWYNLFRDVPVYFESQEDHFKYAPMGTEQEQGVPYWIWLVLPRLFPEKLPGSGGYTSLGITWEDGQEMPIGFTKKTIGFPRVGINCAVCHHTVVRETPEQPSPTIYAAGPSNLFNLQGYIRFLGDAARDPRFTSSYIMDEIRNTYELSAFEKLLYRFFIIPQTRKALLNQRETFTWMDSRPDWGGGRIDPFNPVKFNTLGLEQDDTIGNADMMSIWNQKMRDGDALHWDGLQTSLTETVLSGAIGDGATQKSIDLEGLKRVEDYITQLDPPEYPFSIDQTLADKGRAIFDNSCASCHAFEGERTGTIIPIEEIGSDRHRLDMWTQEAVDAYNSYADGYDWDFSEFQKTDGYVAVPLDGVWIKAPYLHNGSVPNLAALFEKPENRPKTFYRAVDLYEAESVGFVSDGEEVSKTGFLFDTTVAGNGNQGHDYGTDLTSNDKQALIEYLKTL